MTHFDVVVIGSGSGNSLIDSSFSHLRTAIVERGVFGGTCLNVGCIPTKMFVHPADLAASVGESGRLGIDLRLEGVRWRDIRDRVFGRIDAISANGREYRAAGLPGTTLFEGTARFVGDRELRIALNDGGEETITADQVVLAAGSRAVVPPVPGVEDVPVHTSDTIMRIDEVPARLAILGGGVVAAEFAHVFGSFGSQVTIINRSEQLLGSLDEDLSATFTEHARRTWDVRSPARVTHAAVTADGGVRLELSGPGDPGTVEADLLLVATGRRPNSDLLDLAAGGVDVDAAGVVVTDRHQRTSAPGVWALGDVANSFQLKHLANHEARVVQHNLLHPEDLWERDHEHVPAGIFTRPQIATVGLTEAQARAQGVPHVIARQQYGDTAYGWATEDTVGFAKLLLDPDSGHLLGAHLLGLDATTVIQPLITALTFKIPAREFARGQFWIHPALSEVAENALLKHNPPVG
ncbi:mycothione reductase [Nocardioides massiliensis]|uniref:Mycothione reductase n=1 Tax=Nocardioides massiliensis TaxID=1325935 RepID=A0ABT9NK02_9ACTN|nr:mycothione reductase [Nocardioides massiliensis]MDP9820744.1 mycothione reductase [Nocardioides massiliensis]